MSNRSFPTWLAPVLLITIGLALPLGYLAWRGLLPGTGTATRLTGADVADPGVESGEIIESRPGVDSALLYFSDARADGLVAERRDMAESKDLHTRVRAIVRELSAGSLNGLERTIPSGVVAEHVFLDDHGVLYLNLNQALVDGHPGGTRAELLTLRSLTETILANEPQVERVHLLVDGKERGSLRGHVLLSSPERR